MGFLPRELARHLHIEYGAEATSVEEHGDEVRVTWTRPGQGERTKTPAALASLTALDGGRALWGLRRRFTDFDVHGDEGGCGRLLAGFVNRE